MARHGYGRGEYRYFAYPLPDLRSALTRTRSIRELLPVANAGAPNSAAATLPADSTPISSTRCHDAGQRRPTPLLLRYGPGITIACTRIFTATGVPAAGGVPAVRSGGFHRRRVRVDRAAAADAVARAVVPLEAGEAAIFAVNHRPVQGTRGTYRVRCAMASAGCAQAAATPWASSSTTPLKRRALRPPRLRLQL